MPTYEYECTCCGHHFEEFQAMSAKPVSKCPQCGGKVRRLIGAGAAVIVKGRSGQSSTRCGLDAPCPNRDDACDACPYDA